MVSVWSPATGARLKTAVLTAAPVSTSADLTLSYANGRVWLFDAPATGKWHGWNIGL